MDVSSDKTLEEQILEARRRAEIFSRSLSEARQQEALALKILEGERLKWTQTYEDKSVIISELERELSSTVDQLNSERYCGVAPLVVIIIHCILFPTFAIIIIAY
jgi:hypothetical protein